MIRVLSFVFLLIGTCATADMLRVAVTTSFQNSGLSDILLPAFKDDTGVTVQLLVVGTGQALRLGEAGDVDAILVHSRPAEEAFVANGFGTYRREVMYNDFVLIGPSGDPAKIGAARDAAQALRQIAAEGAIFVSRGDDSGTHKKELTLWDAASIAPNGDWYRSVGAGMGAALNTAAAMDAYIMADRASWLNFGNKAGLAVLFDGDAALFNQYAYVPVNPARHAHVRSDLAQTFEDWLTSDRAADLINGYTINDQTLFVFNAESPS